MGSLRRRVVYAARAALLTVPLAFAGAFAAASPSSAAVPPGWSVVAGINPGSQSNAVNGIACVSDADCIAVGVAADEGGGSGALIETWNGSAWSLSAPSSDDGSALNVVTCVSGDDCWAGGSSGDGSALLENFNGTAWTATPLGISSGQVLGLRCQSTTDCYAVGDQDGGSTVLIEHFDGATWAAEAGNSPTAGADAYNQLFDVGCVGPSTCFAVGDTGNDSSSSGLIEEWNGSVWSEVATDTGDLYALACPTATQCFAVGDGGPDGSEAAIVGWNGTSWADVPTAFLDSPGVLEAISCSSADQCVASGADYSGSSTVPLLADWNGASWVAAAPASTSDVDAEVDESYCTSDDCFLAGSAEASPGAPYDVLFEQSVSVTPDGPPQITNVQFPAVVQAGSSFTITWNAASAAGVAETNFSVELPRPSNGNGGILSGCLSATLLGGDANYGAYSETCAVPSAAPDGNYSVSGYAIDEIGQEESLPMGTFTVTGGEDDGPPQITNVQFPAVVQAGSSFTITWNAASAAGVAETNFSVELPRPSNGNGGILSGCLSATLLGGDANYGAYSETCAVPSAAPDGNYSVSGYAIDEIGQEESLQMGTFTVTGGEDDGPPQITNVQFPAVVQAGSSFTITWNAASAAGVAETNFSVELPRPSNGNGGILSGCLSATLLGGDANYGAYSETCAVPSAAPDGNYSVSGYAIDEIGQEESLQMGTFTVTGGIYVAPPPSAPAPVVEVVTGRSNGTSSSSSSSATGSSGAPQRPLPVSAAPVVLRYRAPTPVISLKSSHLVVASDDTVVLVKCSNAVCRGSLTLRVSKSFPNVSAKPKSRASRGMLVLGTGSFAISSGHSAKVAIHLAKAGQEFVSASPHQWRVQLVESLKGSSTHASTVVLNSAPKPVLTHRSK